MTETHMPAPGSDNDGGGRAGPLVGPRRVIAAGLLAAYMLAGTPAQQRRAGVPAPAPGAKERRRKRKEQKLARRKQR
jgi:hypothetical protein